MSHSQLPPLDTVAGDALIGPDIAAFSPSRSRPQPIPSSSKLPPLSSRKNKDKTRTAVIAAAAADDDDDDSVPSTNADESTPLLPTQKPKKKPFYRPRPLWLVPFAIAASLVRGMTLAPRVEVFTQLSCNRLHGHHHWNHTQAPVSVFSSTDPLSPPLFHSAVFPVSNTSTPLSFLLSPVEQDRKDSDDTEDPRRLPSQRCLSDPAVLAGAARIQAIMTTTMGLLSALTTGWWGHFSERHGRTRVMAIATLGLFLTDLTFILVSTPSFPLSRHGHNLLLVAPVIEGFLGGWSTLQSATSAYLSDCTSPGSRAQIFSRFQGVFYLGFAAGPSLGGWLIQHPLRALTGDAAANGGKTVTTVFWVSILFSFVNFMLVLCVFPESLGKKKMEQAVADAEANATAAGKNTAVAGSAAGVENDVGSSGVQETVAADGVIVGFLRPLAVFLPVMVLQPSPNGIGYRKRRDWSLTMLALALFAFMLSTGLYQLKYMYAVQTYAWGAEQLGYYISFMGAGRAVWLLFALPLLIGFFKPKPKQPATADTTGAANAKPLAGKKPKPTRAQLGEEIKFDLSLTRFSVMVDILSHSLVAILPGPARAGIAGMDLGAGAGGVSLGKSQALFVLASSMNGMGSGAMPAIQSLALCMMQVRALNGGEADANGDPASASASASSSSEAPGTGTLFGALAVLQAVGQMILGPMLFGLIYSSTAATFPKAIFVVGAGIMTFALAMILCVRNPVKGVGRRRRLLHGDEAERGRSRVSKDLRGGAVEY